MGNSQPGSGSPVGQSLYTSSTHNSSHNNEVYEAIPVPCQRSASLELELSSSLSGISGLSAHKVGMNSYNDGSGDFISPGQYRSRFRSNSVSVDAAIPAHIPEVKNLLPAVIRWEKGGSEVYVAGSFNKWEKKIPLVKSSHNFYTIIELTEGEHQYKYFVDDRWTVNPDEPTVTDSHGNVHNLVRVKRSDFEILDALDTDSESVTKKDYMSTNYAQKDYGQELPVKLPADKHVGPPVLPQHLLQVILNREVSQHLEPGILPEPNHVMLNHLYALSIKDGVMVLSDTSRFRKKCITTVLYKPIDS